MPRVVQVSSRNASFQQWQAMLRNRHKRQRAGEFLVQGVRPITLAVEHGWAIRTLIYDSARSLSRWATQTLAGSGAQQVAMSPDLLAELGEKPDEPPELLAVVAMPADDFARIPVAQDLLAVAFDRPPAPATSEDWCVRRMRSVRRAWW